jgi:hypothetical protein
VERFEAVDRRSTARSTRDRNGETVAAGNGTQRDRDLRVAGILSAASKRTTEGPVPLRRALARDFSYDKSRRTSSGGRPSVAYTRPRIDASLRA